MVTLQRETAQAKVINKSSQILSNSSYSPDDLYVAASLLAIADDPTSVSPKRDLARRWAEQDFYTLPTELRQAALLRARVARFRRGG